MFVSYNGPKNRVGRYVKTNLIIYFSKNVCFMHDWELEARKKV